MQSECMFSPITLSHSKKHGADFLNFVRFISTATTVIVVIIANWRKQRCVMGKESPLYVGATTYERFVRGDRLLFHSGIEDPKHQNYLLYCVIGPCVAPLTQSLREQVPTDKCIMWPVNGKKCLRFFKHIFYVFHAWNLISICNFSLCNFKDVRTKAVVSLQNSWNVKLLCILIFIYQVLSIKF